MHQEWRLEEEAAARAEAEKKRKEAAEAERGDPLTGNVWQTDVSDAREAMDADAAASSQARPVIATPIPVRRTDREALRAETSDLMGYRVAGGEAMPEVKPGWPERGWLSCKYVPSTGDPGKDAQILQLNNESVYDVLHGLTEEYGVPEPSDNRAGVLAHWRLEKLPGADGEDVLITQSYAKHEVLDPNLITSRAEERGVAPETWVDLGDWGKNCIKGLLEFTDKPGYYLAAWALAFLSRRGGMVDTPDGRKKAWSLAVDQLYDAKMYDRKKPD